MAPKELEGAKQCNLKPQTKAGFRGYPTDRDHPLKSPMKWINGKRIDDDIGPYWRIHDKLYDVTKFINRHPGGRAWLELTKGTDITEAFESAHVTEKASSLLSNFYVREADVPRNSPYTFHENGFFKTFKRKVRPILQKVGTGPTLKMLMIQDGLMLIFCLLGLYAASKHCYYAAIAAGIALAMTAMCAHNFFHQKDNFRMNYFDLTLLSSHEWRISHALSHHLFTNSIYDIEISQLEPYWEYLPKPNKTFLQRYGCIVYEQIFMPTVLFLEAIKKILFLFTGEAKFRIQNLFPYFELFVMMMVAPSLGAGLKTWAVIHSACSFWFSGVGIIVAHHHPDIYREGDKFRDEDPDWGLCQLDAVRDRAEITGNLFLVATTFGDHTLHHLLPTVDHSKLHYCYDALFATCKEFDIPFHFVSQWELFKGKYLCLASNKPNMNPPGFKRKTE
ncbi:hypothetical protein SK128_015235 [Halocaridina rubra]|uniref:Cytochrome b5 heme-binding domain-containing protein n=1 Tax=Halocaridina rubra TaxID=373956 RepID=A0AAN8WD28_HALRR